MKVARKLYDKGAILQDIFLTCDEMYLHEGIHCHDGDKLGANGHGNLFCDIFVLIKSIKISKLLSVLLQKINSI